MKKCCMCNVVIEKDDAPILAMGAVGNPKLLCDSCAELLDTAMAGREYKEIEAAMDEIGRKMGEGNPDRTTFNIVSGLMAEAAGRAKAIKLGKYDFSRDEDVNAPSEDELEEIPEELRESEEDIAKDKEDEEKMKKFDKIYNILLIVLGAITLGVIIWKIVTSFL